MCVCLHLVAHGRVVTSSRQITEVKQAFHIMSPLSTQQ